MTDPRLLSDEEWSDAIFKAAYGHEWAWEKLRADHQAHVERAEKLKDENKTLYERIDVLTGQRLELQEQANHDAATIAVLRESLEEVGSYVERRVPMAMSALSDPAPRAEALLRVVEATKAVWVEGTDQLRDALAAWEELL